MNVPAGRSSWIPEYGLWVMGTLLIAVALVGNWTIAAGLLILILAHMARPFDFLVSFVVVVAFASFVYYEGGRLTYQLSILSCTILLMLACYVFASRGQVLTISRTSLTGPILFYLVWTVANVVRGVLAGYAWKYIGLELIAALALGSALLVANAFDVRRDLRLAVGGLIAIALANAALGFYIFSVLRFRTGGVYFTPVPGIVGLLLFNLALRSKRALVSAGWIVLSLPLFLHQFLSYTRSIWLGCLAGILISILIFVGFARGSGARWRRAGAVLGTVAILGLLGAFGMAGIFGQTDFLQLAGSRLGSIGETELSTESVSNVARLMEYSIVMKHIAGSPWFGHGLGYTFLGTEPVGFVVFSQWWVHQNYLFVWLKQGLIGLLLFLWMIGAGILLGAREAPRRGDVWESAWFATTAGGTVLLAVLSLANFPFGEVNATFALALLWGGAMAMTRRGVVRIRWATGGVEKAETGS